MTTVVPEKRAQQTLKVRKLGHGMKRRLALESAKACWTPPINYVEKLRNVKLPKDGNQRNVVGNYDRWTKGYKARVRDILASRDGGWICHWCKRKITHSYKVHCHEAATIDHLIRRCDGGPDTIDNLVLACGLCNSQRHTKPDHPWYRNQPKPLLRTALLGGFSSEKPLA